MFKALYVHNWVLLFGGSFSSIIDYRALNSEAFHGDGAFGSYFEYLLLIQIELRLQPTYCVRLPQRFKCMLLNFRSLYYYFFGSTSLYQKRRKSKLLTRRFVFRWVRLWWANPPTLCCFCFIWLSFGWVLSERCCVSYLIKECGKGKWTTTLNAMILYSSRKSRMIYAPWIQII